MTGTVKLENYGIVQESLRLLDSIKPLSRKEALEKIEPVDKDSLIVYRIPKNSAFERVLILAVTLSQEVIETAEAKGGYEALSGDVALTEKVAVSQFIKRILMSEVYFTDPFISGSCSLQVDGDNFVVTAISIREKGEYLAQELFNTLSQRLNKRPKGDGLR